MVSVVVLAYNEASRISYCLDSLSEFSEVIVLDMYSTDDTCQIAENFGAKVIKVPAREKFDILREEGIKVAKYDWILFIDADELVPKLLCDYIHNTIKSDSKVDVYKIPRVNYVFGNKMLGCGYWPDSQIKLFKKGSLTLSEEVHNFMHVNKESIVASFPVNENLAIQHFTNNSVFDFISKMNVYTSIASGKKKKKTSSALSLFFRLLLFRFIRARGFKSKMGLDFSMLLAFYGVVQYMKEKYPAVDYRQEKEDIIKEYKL